MSSVFASVLSMMYMAFVGTALSTVDYACSKHMCRSVNDIKYGGIIGLIFVSSVLFLWPFYLRYPSSATQLGGFTTSQQLEERRSMPGYGTS